MNAIINVGPLSIGASPFQDAPVSRTALLPSHEGSDTVEISSGGSVLARAMEQSSLRIAKTRAVRAEIQAGTYETPERIARTVDRILDVIA